MTSPHQDPHTQGHGHGQVSGPPASPYPGPYPQHQLPQPQIVMMARPTSGLAVTSMILGIIGILGGWCMAGIPCIAAVILGHMALPATRDGTVGGHGMAIAGLVMGYLFVIPAIIFFGLGFLGSLLPSP